MAVVLTPVLPKTPCCETGASATPLTAVDCRDQFVLVPQDSKSRGQSVLTRTKAIKIKGGQKATIEWVMRDNNGNPVNLSGCECQDESSSASVLSDSSVSVECKYNLKFCLKEYLSLNRYGCADSLCALPVTVVNEAEGLVRVEVPKEYTKIPGIYFGEFAVVGLDEDGKEYVLFSNTLYVNIEGSGWSARRRHRPPTIAEIRLHLRDSSPSESYLLDNLKFDDAEISAALVRPIQQWNEMPPPVGVYTTSNFPFPYHWMEAAIGNLFLMAAEQFRANNLTYSAAGVQVDDQNKEPNYEAAAQRRLANWMQWMKLKKAEQNLAQGFGQLRSAYY